MESFEYLASGGNSNSITLNFRGRPQFLEKRTNINKQVSENRAPISD
jgi:hypothetical protein